MSAKGFEIKELDQKPSIVGLEWIWNGFWDLSTERQIGMGIGPIPWSKIAQYADRLGLTEDEYYEFKYFVNFLDQKFLAHHHKEPKRASNPPKNAGGDRGQQPQG